MPTSLTARTSSTRCGAARRSFSLCAARSLLGGKQAVALGDPACEHLHRQLIRIGEIHRRPTPGADLVAGRLLLSKLVRRALRLVQLDHRLPGPEEEEGLSLHFECRALENRTL